MVRNIFSIWLWTSFLCQILAVKCNPDPVILRLLASLGSSFDCATMGEIGRAPSFLTWSLLTKWLCCSRLFAFVDLVLNGLGSDCQLNRNPNFAASSIVYANPAKMPHVWLIYLLVASTIYFKFFNPDALICSTKWCPYDRIRRRRWTL